MFELGIFTYNLISIQLQIDKKRRDNGTRIGNTCHFESI